jgi:hypothetical protein
MNKMNHFLTIHQLFNFHVHSAVPILSSGLMDCGARPNVINMGFSIMYKVVHVKKFRIVIFVGTCVFYIKCIKF